MFITKKRITDGTQLRNTKMLWQCQIARSFCMFPLAFILVSSKSGSKQSAAHPWVWWRHLAGQQSRLKPQPVIFQHQRNENLSKPQSSIQKLKVSRGHLAWYMTSLRVHSGVLGSTSGSFSSHPASC